MHGTVIVIKPTTLNFEFDINKLDPFELERCQHELDVDYIENFDEDDFARIAVEDMANFKECVMDLIKQYPNGDDIPYGVIRQAKHDYPVILVLGKGDYLYYKSFAEFVADTARLKLNGLHPAFLKIVDALDFHY